jgi:outer membrane receptor for ferrienterochelin and colicins
LKKIIKIACLIAPLGLFANEASDLENILEQTTQIATKTKLNIDFVPGTVTVVSGAQLKSLGITDLSEPNAFDVIVGFDSSVLGMRGAGSIYGSQGNKIKWMINDKPISSEIWGNGYFGIGRIAFPIPVDAVDRVEIIRGAGSAIYGGNAIFGVVNIVTKKETNALFTTLSRTENDKFGRTVGALGYFKKDDFSVGILASTFKNDGWNLNVGGDGNFYDSYNANHTTGYGPGNLPNATGAETLMVDAEYKKYSFWAYRLKMNNNYAQIGWNPTIPLAKDSDSPVQHNTTTMVGVQKEYTIFDGVSLNAKLGYTLFDNVADSLFVWPASRLTGNVANVDGVASKNYVEEKQYAEATLEKRLGGHRLLGGVYLGKTAVIKDETTKNYSGIAYAPDTKSAYLDGSNPKRFQNALFAQDEIELRYDTTLTVGARNDSFSDTGGAFSPRIALVYRFDDSNIFKAQWSRAFRPPSFIEKYNSLYQDKQLKPETVDTLELGYVFKGDDTSAKATIFHSDIKNMITFHDFTYDSMNLEKLATISGLELEAVKTYESIEFAANFAFYKTHRDGVVADYGSTPTNDSYFNYNASQFGLSANFLANFLATLNKSTNYPTTIWYHYTGSKNRANNDLLDGSGNIRSFWGTPKFLYSKNGSTPAQDYLNITQKVKGLTKGLELDFGVKNAFGKTLQTLNMPLNPPNNQDVPYMRQTLWINASYKF